jgi:serine/threonine-protein kinase
MRRLDSKEAVPLEASRGAFETFFSPDGHWLGFNAGQSLFKASLRGGVATPIAEIGFSLRGASWSVDGFIYYVTAAEGRLFRVAAAGSTEPELVAAPDTTAGELRMARPFALPSGKAVLIQVTHEGRPPSIEAVDPITGSRKDLGLAGFHPLYSDGYIVFAAEGRALAAPFDAETVEVVGEPLALQAKPAIGETMQLTVSAEGSMAYLDANRLARAELVVVSHDGTEAPLMPGGVSATTMSDLRFSPDGTRVLYSSNDGISMLDLRSTTESRVDDDGFYPLWSPDGESLVHGIANATNYDLVRRHADLRPEQEVLLDWETPLRPAEWSEHGFIFRDQIPGKGMDLKLLPADLHGEPQPLLEDEATELAPDISPDGRWLAFQSDQSGRDEIYVTSFPQSGRRTQVSSAGGRSPAWSPDGSTLYYFESGTFVAASLAFDPEPRVVGRESLFSGNYYQYRWHRQYDVHPDGDRFLMVRFPEGQASVELVLDWTQELAEASG